MKHKAFSKQEIAALYFPEDSKRNAGRKFAAMLRRTPGLQQRLYSETRYAKTQKILTPRQVRIIFDTLGDP